MLRLKIKNHQPSWWFFSFSQKIGHEGRFSKICGISLLIVHAVRCAASEALHLHATDAADSGRLAHIRDHLASAEARLERDVRSAVVVARSEAHAVLRTLFGVVRAEAEHLAALDGCFSVAVDHATHAAIHAAFNDDDATRNECAEPSQASG